MRFFAFAFLIVGSLSAVPVGAVERTFVLTPADLAATPNLFGAKARSRSATLWRALGLKRDVLRFARGVCPALLADPTRKLTRVRLLGASGKTRQAHWIAEAPIVRTVGFATLGFTVGDQTGALGKGEDASRVPGFRMNVDLATEPGVGPAELPIAVTTELPATTLGKPGERIECILVASLLPVDIQALRDLENAAPLTSGIRDRLTGFLDSAQTFFDRGELDRVARKMRAFALLVAQHSATGIPPAFAEPMINRANAAAEALSF